MLAEYWDCNQDDLEVGIVSSIIWQISEYQNRNRKASSYQDMLVSGYL